MLSIADKKSRYILSVALFFLMAFSPALGIVYAQTSQVKISDTLATQPSAIPIYNIVQSIGEAGGEIKRATQTISPKRSLLRIDSLYMRYTELIDERKKQAELFTNSRPTRREIENLANTWRGYRSFLNSWNLSISNYLGRNAIISDQLSDKEEIWDLTYQNAMENEVPVEVLRRIKSTRDAYKEIDQTILKYNNQFFQI